VLGQQVDPEVPAVQGKTGLREEEEQVAVRFQQFSLTLGWAQMVRHLRLDQRRLEHSVVEVVVEAAGRPTIPAQAS
jgi:hypothetical protein